MSGFAGGLRSQSALIAGTVIRASVDSERALMIGTEADSGSHMALFMFRSVYRVLRGLDDLGDNLDLSIDHNDGRASAARFGRGNVPMQANHFVGPNDLERERER